MAALAAAHNVKPLLAEDVQYVIVACAKLCNCPEKKEWPHLLREAKMDDLVPLAEKVAAKTIMFSELVSKLIAEKKLTPKDGLKLRKLYLS